MLWFLRQYQIQNSLIISKTNLLSTSNFSGVMAFIANIKLNNFFSSTKFQFDKISVRQGREKI